MTLKELQCPRYAFYGFQSPNWGSFNYISINYAKNNNKFLFIIRTKLKIPYMKKKIKEVGVFIYHFQTTKNLKSWKKKKKKISLGVTIGVWWVFHLPLGCKWDEDNWFDASRKNDTRCREYLFHWYEFWISSTFQSLSKRSNFKEGFQPCLTKFQNIF